MLQSIKNISSYVQCTWLNVWSVYFYFNTLSCWNYFFQREWGVYKIQYRSNVSYHLDLSRFSRDAYHFSQDTSCFSQDESHFSREASRFSQESLKHLVWNILYMYILALAVSFHTGSRGVPFDGIWFQQTRNMIACLQFKIITYSSLNQQQIASRYNCTVNSTENTVK